jgi:hypothetical protein
MLEVLDCNQFRSGTGRVHLFQMCAIPPTRYDSCGCDESETWVVFLTAGIAPRTQMSVLTAE